MVNKIKKHIGGKGSFQRNALIMSSGAMINVLVSLVLYPIVARLYTEEDFGGFGIFMAIVSLVSLAGTSLYPTGLVIPKFKRDFYALLKLSLMLTAITLVGTVLFIVFFRDTFLYIFKAYSIQQYLYLIPIGVLLFCLKDIFVNWNVRNKLFKKNASANIVDGTSLKGLNIIYALTLGASSFGLIVSKLISVLLSTLTLGLANMLNGISILRRISFSEMKTIAKKYSKYPTHLLPGNLLNKYTSDLPIYLLAAYFSPAITGAFVFANSIMNIPLNVIGNSISSVFLQRANELYINDKQEMSVFARKIHDKILILGVLAFGALFGFGDILFSFVFGSKWNVAGQMAGILSVYFVFKLIAGPMAKVFRVVGKEQYSLYVSIVLAITRSVSLWFGVKTGDPLKALLYFTIGSTIGYIFTSALVFKACNLSIPLMLTKAILVIAAGFLIYYFIRVGFNQVFGYSFQ